MGRGIDRIYVLCAADDPGAQPGVEEGDHTVQMEATLPGRDEVIRSNSVSFTLSCAAAFPDDQEEEDILAPDAGEVNDAAVDAGGDDPAEGNPPDSGGCGCGMAR